MAALSALSLSSHASLAARGIPKSSYSVVQRRRNLRIVSKRMFDDPFDYGADPDMEYGSLLSQGRQSASAPRLPRDETSDSGFLTFPEGFNPEIASLGLYIRGDVRKAAVFVSGGVYENLLFFPVLQLFRERYPGVELDVIASERGKQVYEINKNVRRAWVYDVDDVLVVPADFVEMLGKIKNNCYDLVVSTRPAGLGHAIFLFLSDARQRLSYVLPNANGAGAGTFLSTALRADVTNLASRGYHMYKELVDHLLIPSSLDTTDDVPLRLPPLRVSVGRRVREVARGQLAAAGVQGQGGYVLVHGLASSSAASMRSRGDLDSQLAPEVVAQLSKATSDTLVVVIPNENERARLAAVVGPSVIIVKITTPGQLAAVIDDSIGVVTTNTAALQLAVALDKPTVALFGSAEKAELFVPNASDTKVSIVASKTGKLADIDVKAAAVALSTFARDPKTSSA